MTDDAGGPDDPSDDDRPDGSEPPFGSDDGSQPTDPGPTGRDDDPSPAGGRTGGDAHRNGKSAPPDHHRPGPSAGDSSDDAGTDRPPWVDGDGPGSDPPRPRPGSSAGRDESLLTRFRTARSGPLVFVREALYSALGVIAVGLLLFAISGVWPPMVAVESGSMEPEMQRGDLVFVTEPQRFTPDYAHDGTGIVTVAVGSEEGYRSFGGNGSVIIYDPPDRVGSPIIHRAQFHVEAGENWYDRADPAYLNADDCESLANCPAPHDGFITKGDANGRYDQASNISTPVRPGWIQGTARLRIPYLGHIRLRLAGALAA
jgi:signal peptidase